MDIERVEDIFKGRKAEIIGEYKRSAVMLLMLKEKGEQKILFEVRSEKLNHQPGDVCLPGGRMEQGETPLETALRETIEELNINKENIKVIGEMDYFVSPYGSIIYPFIGILNSNKIIPNEDEVGEVFTVPLEFFLENEPIKYETRIVPSLTEDFPYELIKGGKNYKFSTGKLNQYFYKYDKYVIWGFTALVIKRFVDILKGSI